MEEENKERSSSIPKLDKNCASPAAFATVVVAFAVKAPWAL
jgi:hypothetical protein